MIFQELLDDRESEFYMRGASEFLKLEEDVSFYTVQKAVNESVDCGILLNYRQREDGKYCLNPKVKSIPAIIKILI
ncbi:hypothetical protein [Eggerthia catenaformis]|uniref:hypothetical protein n=1 Tax=Eggerthia catenaformis TaxID=31973 RepID=UPI00248D9BE2|nr:hypothetical protein [Eggerthia catenaformis]